jgi:hypothetical protein
MTAATHERSRDRDAWPPTGLPRLLPSRPEDLHGHLARYGPVRDAFAAMYGSDLGSWRAARASLDPASRFRSDLGRRLGLVDP